MLPNSGQAGLSDYWRGTPTPAFQPLSFPLCGPSSNGKLHDFFLSAAYQMVSCASPRKLDKHSVPISYSDCRDAADATRTAGVVNGCNIKDGVLTTTRQRRPV